MIEIPQLPQTNKTEEIGRMVNDKDSIVRNMCWTILGVILEGLTVNVKETAFHGLVRYGTVSSCVFVGGWN